jgi:hypothetical protein
MSGARPPIRNARSRSGGLRFGSGGGELEDEDDETTTRRRRFMIYAHANSLSLRQNSSGSDQSAYRIILSNNAVNRIRRTLLIEEGSKIGKCSAASWAIDGVPVCTIFCRHQYSTML